MRNTQSMRSIIGFLAVVSVAAACGHSDLSGSTRSATDKAAAATQDGAVSPSQDATGTTAPAVASGTSQVVAASGTTQVATASGTTATPAIPASVSAPGVLTDVSKTGFQCPKDMSLAAGAWSGTYTGSAVAGVVPVSGAVNFSMGKIDAVSLQVTQFGIAGGLFGGDQVKSIAIDFQMKCGDLALHDAVVNFEGKTIAVKLAFSQQGWNPPTFAGTWVAHIDPLNVTVASGTWIVKKN